MMNREFIKNTIRGMNLADAVIIVVSCLKNVFEASVQGWQTSKLKQLVKNGNNGKKGKSEERKTNSNNNTSRMDDEYREDVKLGQVYHTCYIAHRLGIQQVIIVVNKFDDPRINYSVERFDFIKRKLTKMLIHLGYKTKYIAIIPISAYYNENVCIIANSKNVKHKIHNPTSKQTKNNNSRNSSNNSNDNNKQHRLYPWYNGYSVQKLATKKENKSKNTGSSQAGQKTNNNENYTLLDAICNVLQIPKRYPDKPFRMQIFKQVIDDEDRYSDNDEDDNNGDLYKKTFNSKSNRIVIGLIEKGTVYVKDKVCLVCSKNFEQKKQRMNIICQIVSIEYSHTKIDYAQGGDIIGLELKCLSSQDGSFRISSGDWIYCYKEEIKLNPQFRFVFSFDALLFLFRSSRNVGINNTTPKSFKPKFGGYGDSDSENSSNYIEYLEEKSGLKHRNNNNKLKNVVYKHNGRIKHCLHKNRSYGNINNNNKKCLKRVSKFGWMPILYFGHNHTVCELFDIKWKIQSNVAVSVKSNSNSNSNSSNSKKNVDKILQPNYVESGYQALVTFKPKQNVIVLPFESKKLKTGRILILEDRYLCGICKIVSVNYKSLGNNNEMKQEYHFDSDIKQNQSEVQLKNININEDNVQSSQSGTDSGTDEVDHETDDCKGTHSDSERSKLELVTRIRQLEQLVTNQAKQIASLKTVVKHREDTIFALQKRLKMYESQNE